jgi:hypothetical protein
MIVPVSINKQVIPALLFLTYCYRNQREGSEQGLKSICPLGWLIPEDKRAGGAKPKTPLLSRQSKCGIESGDCFLKFYFIFSLFTLLLFLEASVYLNNSLPLSDLFL